MNQIFNVSAASQKKMNHQTKLIIKNMYKLCNYVVYNKLCSLIYVKVSLLMKMIFPFVQCHRNNYKNEIIITDNNYVYKKIVSIKSADEVEF